MHENEETRRYNIVEEGEWEGGWRADGKGGGGRWKGVEGGGKGGEKGGGDLLVHLLVGHLPHLEEKVSHQSALPSIHMAYSEDR